MKLFFKISLLIFTLFITVVEAKSCVEPDTYNLVDNNQWLDYMRNNRLSNAELGRIGAAFVYKGHEQFMYSPQVDFAVTALSSLTGITEGVIMLSGFAKKMILRLIAKKAAKRGMKLLSQFNSAESLIQGAGKLERLSGGVRQGFVKGNPEAIFKSITNGGTILPSGAVKMTNGTFIRLYNSTTTGIPSIHINTPSMFYKIRITP